MPGIARSSPSAPGLSYQGAAVTGWQWPTLPSFTLSLVSLLLPFLRR